jgi:hypothetical protein
VTGPLADGRGRFAELLHIVWLLKWPAGPHVLAAQEAALPAQVDLAGRPRTLRLFADAASSRTSLAELRSALRDLSQVHNQYPERTGCLPPNPFLRPQAGRNPAAARCGSYSG